MYPPLLFRRSRSLNRRPQAALAPRVHRALQASLRRLQALFKSNTLLRSWCGLLTDGSKLMTLTASSCSKSRRTELVELRSTSLSYSMGQFISIVLSFLNAAPCFGLLSRSTHINSVGQYCKYLHFPHPYSICHEEMSSLQMLGPSGTRQHAICL